VVVSIALKIPPSRKGASLPGPLPKNEHGAEDHSENAYEDQKALAWERFNEEPPQSVAHWIIEALRYLVEQEMSIESCLPLLV
jgi:Phosphorylase b kinase C-terminal domain